jgi:hypothetical protein
MDIKEEEGRGTTLRGMTLMNDDQGVREMSRRGRPVIGA